MDEIAHVIVLIAMLADIALIVRGLSRWFDRGSPTAKIWWILLGSPIAWGIQVWRVGVAFTGSTFCQGLALALLIAAGWLFSKAASACREARFTRVFSTDLPVRIVRQGPYRFVRHPFYTSYLLVFGSGVIASCSLWTIIPALAMAAVYVHAARFEESKFARSEQAQAYRAYASEVRMFVPKLKSIREAFHASRARPALSSGVEKQE